MPFSGVVLCGGASRRMGRDKALIEVDGCAMATRVADSLWEAGATEVLAIGGDAAALSALGLVVRADDEPGGGPLPATLTALRAASEPMVMVASCDLLHPDPTSIRSVVEALQARPDAQGAVPLVAAHRQWTHAAWWRSSLPLLETAHRYGARSLHRAAADLALVEVRLSSASVADANHPSDLG